MRYGFVIDQRKCIGCHACTVACKEENQVPLGVNRTWVKYIEKGTFPDTRRYFSVMRCNHCDNAPCVTICPTVALYRRPDGIVDFDGDRCIGCKSCMQACPYDALYIDPETQTAAKCHYCAHRVEVGLEPACVIVCPVQAIVPGDLDDPNSGIARLVATAAGGGAQAGAGDAAQALLSRRRRGRADAGHAGGAATAIIFAEASRIPVPGGANVAGGAAPPSAATAWTCSAWRGRSTTWRTRSGPGAGRSRRISGPSRSRRACCSSRMAAIAGRRGACPWPISPSLISLVFLALTVLLLTFDLKRPERFLYLFFKPNWRSWLVWGGWILLAYGGLASLWFLARRVAGRDELLLVLAWPTALLAVGGGRLQRLPLRTGRRARLLAKPARACLI